MNIIKSNVLTFIQKTICEEQELIIREKCAHIKLKNVLMVIVVVNHIINMNNCIKKMFIEQNFVLSLKIVVMECFVHSLTQKKILNVN